MLCRRDQEYSELHSHRWYMMVLASYWYSRSSKQILHSHARFQSCWYLKAATETTKIATATSEWFNPWSHRRWPLTVIRKLNWKISWDTYFWMYHLFVVRGKGSFPGAFVSIVWKSNSNTVELIQQSYRSTMTLSVWRQDPVATLNVDVEYLSPVTVDRSAKSLI